MTTKLMVIAFEICLIFFRFQSVKGNDKTKNWDLAQNFSVLYLFFSSKLQSNTHIFENLKDL
jgi:hypothetical protein